MVVLGALGFAFLAGLVGWVVGHETRLQAPRTVTVVSTAGEAPPPPATVPAQGNPARGEEVFAQAGCGSCHVLAAARATGTIGPDLNETRPGFELVLDRVRNGKGAMPAFDERLSDRQIADVAAFVAESAGR